MSITHAQPAQAPVSVASFGAASFQNHASDKVNSGSVASFEARADTPARWAAALKRATVAGITVYRLTDGRFAVPSTTAANVAYISDGIRCNCAAGLAQDPVCAHRAAVRAFLAPDPPAPSTAAHDALKEALRFAENDRARAWRDLEYFNQKLNRDGRLTDREYQGLIRAQERELDAHDAIVAAKAALTDAQTASYAA